MDPELIAYLDSHFGQTSQQFVEIQRQFGEVRQQISDVQQSLQEQITALGEETRERFEQIDRRFEEVETTCRQTLVLVEGLRHELQVVAEGYLGVNERLQVQVEKSDVLSSQMQAWMEPYFKDLDIRVKSMEGRVDRQNMDVFEAVHKILGRPLPQRPLTG